MKGKLTKKKIIFLIALFIVLFETIFNRHVGENQTRELVKVIRIVDGDTIIIEGNKKVRYIGIDTPETKDPKKSIQCYGQEAAEKNRQLVEEKYVFLKKDVSEVDKYNRLLRYVWLTDPNNASSEGIFINDYLVRQGYAHAATFPPDVKYADTFLIAEKYARDNYLGLWSSCPVKK